MSAAPNPLASKLHALAAAGIPREGLTEKVLLYRAESGTLSHGNVGCGRLSRARKLMRRVNLLEVDMQALCPCVVEITEPTLQTYVDHATFIVKVNRWARSLEDKNLTVADVATARAHRLTAREHSQTIHVDLVPLLEDVAGKLERLLDSGLLSDLSAREQRIVAHRCWRKLAEVRPTGNWDIHKFVPTFDKVDLTLLRTDRYGQANKALLAAWAAWGEALDAGAGTENARAAAKAAGQTESGTSPLLLTQVPDKPRFAAVDFATPQEWATAEWVVARDELLDQVLAQWETIGEEALMCPEHDRVALAVRVGDVPSSTKQDLELVLSAYATTNSGDLYLFSAPRLVADWFETEAKTANSKRTACLDVAPIGSAEFDTDAVYETAMSLRESDGTAGPIGEYLSTARMLLRVAA